MLEVGSSFKLPSPFFFPVQPSKLCGLVKYKTLLSFTQWGTFCKVRKEFLADEVVTFKCSLGIKCTESPRENNVEKMPSLILDVTDIASTPLFIWELFGFGWKWREVWGCVLELLPGCCFSAADLLGFNPDSQTSMSMLAIFSKMLISWVPHKIT